MEMQALQLDNKEISISKDSISSGNSWWLEAELNVKPGATAGFKIAQKKDSIGNTIEETEIGYNATKNQVYVDRSKSGNDKIRKDKIRQTIDLINKNSKVKLEILFDKSSLEVFVNNGEAALTTYIYPSKGADLLSAFSTGGNTLIKSLKIWNLSEIKN